MSEQSWIVLKFGGTSVADAAGWAQIARLVEARLQQGYRVALVCSAIRGVTETLERWSLAATESDRSSAWATIQSRHRVLASEFAVDADDLLDAAETRLADIPLGSDDVAHIARVLAEGELLSTRLGRRILESLGVSANWVDARDWLQTESVASDSDQRRLLAARCEVQPADWSADSFRTGDVHITPGFLALTQTGETALVGRGGSDTSAAYLAARLGAEQVEIWTDVPGVFSSSPSEIADVRLLRALSYDEALELAATGARVVHPRSIRVCRSCNIPMLVASTRHPGLGGTRISGPASSDKAGNQRASCIKAVTLRRSMRVLLLENRRPSDAVGFLAGVFAVIADQGLSIDLVATSETTTTLALDAAANHLDDYGLQRLVVALGQRCHVTVESDCASVSLIGTDVRSQLPEILSGFRLPKTWLMSFSASDLNFSMVVPEDSAESLTRQLHARLLQLNQSNDAVFGPGWQTLTRADRAAGAGCA